MHESEALNRAVSLDPGPYRKRHVHLLSFRHDIEVYAAAEDATIATFVATTELLCET